MTDKELLEMAAKAAGYTLKWGEVYIVGDDEVDCTDQPYVVSGRPDEADWYWDPLTDDGDALRLAVKLNIGVRPHGPDHWHQPNVSVSLWDFGERSGRVVVEHGNDPARATRRAIVRAAAEIGRAMP